MKTIKFRLLALLAASFFTVGEVVIFAADTHPPHPLSALHTGVVNTPEVTSLDQPRVLEEHIG